MTASSPYSSPGAGGLAFLAGVGPELVFYHVDADACILSRAQSIRLPQNIQYAWLSPGGEFLYVTTSEGFPGKQGSENHLTALKIDWQAGAFEVHGPQIPLRARPIHMTMDAAGSYLVTAYNAPFATVHRLQKDGAIGEEIAQPPGLDVGFYPHQIRVAPSDKTAIIVSRGHRLRRDKDAQPGGLHVLDFSNGRLANKAVVAPDGGHSFGPRHLDFHPTKPWIYVSLELQNQLHMYDFSGDTVSSQPVFVKDTLRASALVGPDQILGPIHVHPNGRFVYTANRAHGTVEFERKRCFIGGENTIAVFRINQDTGEPVLVQNADTHGLHARTFGMDPAGRLLVAAHVKGAYYRDTSTSTAYRPACLSVFRVGDDGCLTFVRKYDIETEDSSRRWIYWAGMVAGANGSAQKSTKR